MGRPVHDVLTDLGARRGADGTYVLDLEAFSTTSVFGGALMGDAQVSAASDEKLSFQAPHELARMGVLWMPSLESAADLVSAVAEAHARVRDRVDEELSTLRRLGFTAHLDAPHARAHAQTVVDGHDVDIAIDGNGDIVLVRVDGADVDAEVSRAVVSPEEASPDDARARLERAVARVLDRRARAAFDNDDNNSVLREPNDEWDGDDAVTRATPTPASGVKNPPLSEEEKSALQEALADADDDDDDLARDASEDATVAAPRVVLEPDAPEAPAAKRGAAHPAIDALEDEERTAALPAAPRPEPDEPSQRTTRLAVVRTEDPALSADAPDPFDAAPDGDASGEAATTQAPVVAVADDADEPPAPNLGEVDVDVDFAADAALPELPDAQPTTTLAMPAAPLPPTAQAGPTALTASGLDSQQDVASALDEGEPPFARISAGAPPADDGSDVTAVLPVAAPAAAPPPSVDDGTATAPVVTAVRPAADDATRRLSTREAQEALRLLEAERSLSGLSSSSPQPSSPQPSAEQLADRVEEAPPPVGPTLALPVQPVENTDEPPRRTDEGLSQFPPVTGGASDEELDARPTSVTPQAPALQAVPRDAPSGQPAVEGAALDDDRSDPSLRPQAPALTRQAASFADGVAAEASAADDASAAALDDGLGAFADGTGASQRAQRPTREEDEPRLGPTLPQGDPTYGAGGDDDEGTKTRALVIEPGLLLRLKRDAEEDQRRNRPPPSEALTPPAQPAPGQAAPDPPAPAAHGVDVVDQDDPAALLAAAEALEAQARALRQRATALRGEQQLAELTAERASKSNLAAQAGRPRDGAKAERSERALKLEQDARERLAARDKARSAAPTVPALPRPQTTPDADLDIDIDIATSTRIPALHPPPSSSLPSLPSMDLQSVPLSSVAARSAEAALAADQPAGDDEVDDEGVSFAAVRAALAEAQGKEDAFDTAVGAFEGLGDVEVPDDDLDDVFGSSTTPQPAAQAFASAAEQLRTGRSPASLMGPSSAGSPLGSAPSAAAFGDEESQTGSATAPARKPAPTALRGHDGGGNERTDHRGRSQSAGAFASRESNSSENGALDISEDDTRAREPAPRGGELAAAVGIVVEDARARDRLKRHLQPLYPELYEAEHALEASRLPAVQRIRAFVFVRPSSARDTLEGLRRLAALQPRPRVLVLSSDELFDDVAGVDLRLELGQRAGEVARQILDGLEQLGIRPQLAP